MKYPKRSYRPMPLALRLFNLADIRRAYESGSGIYRNSEEQVEEK